MFVNAVVFQALAASIAISGASAHSHRRARRGDIVRIETTLTVSPLLEATMKVVIPEKRQFPDPFTAIGHPVGSLVSSILPDGITQNPSFNTQVSSIAAQVSSAIPTISPIVSIVTFVFPVSQTSSSSPIATMAPPPPPPSSEAPPAPSPETQAPSSSSSATTQGACATATTTVTETVTVTATATATSTVEATPEPTAPSAPANKDAAATCGPHALPCALEPIASVIKSVVPAQTMAPQLNSAVSMVAAAVSSANPELSTPKEITDKILPFPVPGRA